MPLNRAGFSTGFPAAHQRARIKCISEMEDVVVVGEVACTWSRKSLTVRGNGAVVRPGGFTITYSSPRRNAVAGLRNAVIDLWAGSQSTGANENDTRPG